MRAFFEFCLCMGICLFVGIIVFQWHMTLRLVALYALISLAYAGVMERVVYGMVLR